MSVICLSIRLDQLHMTSSIFGGRDDLEFIFDALLPELSGGKVLLDIGSRIGAVLFGAYIYSNASAIIG